MNISSNIIQFEKYIIDKSYKTIFPLNNIVVFNYLNSKYRMRFFKANKKDEVFLNSDLNKLSDAEFKDNYSIFHINNKQVYIIYENKGLIEVLYDLKKKFSNNDYLSLEIDNYIYCVNRKIFVNDSLVIYKDRIKSTSVGFDLNEKIYPKYFIYGTQCKLYNLPKYKPYTRESIFISPKGTISSVKLFGGIRHPNSDSNGYYCIGDLSDEKISDNLLNKLISNIEIFNINSCYYIPDEIIKIIESQS